MSSPWTFSMDWISTACGDQWNHNEILKICQERKEHLLIANVRVWRGTYIGWKQIYRSAEGRDRWWRWTLDLPAWQNFHIRDEPVYRSVEERALRALAYVSVHTAGLWTLCVIINLSFHKIFARARFGGADTGPTGAVCSRLSAARFACMRRVRAAKLGSSYTALFVLCYNRDQPETRHRTVTTWLSRDRQRVHASHTANNCSLVKLLRQRCRIPKFKGKTRIKKWIYDSRRVQIRTTTSLWTSPHLSVTRKRQ